MQGELLRCKTIQVSIAHQREVAALGAARDRHQRALGQAREQEVRFWREVTSSHLCQPSFASSNLASGVHRALDAHRKVREAHATLTVASRQVEQGLAGVARSKVALSAFEKMRSAESRQRGHRVAEAYGEEVSELAVARLCLEKREMAVELGVACSDERATRTLSVGGMEPASGRLTVSPSNEARGAEQGTPAAVYRGPCLAGSGELAHEVKAPRLFVTVREVSGAEVRCEIRQEREGRVGIAIASGHSGVVSTLRHEKGVLLSRLSALGISVKELSVDGISPRNSEHGTLHRFKRRRAEEFDESAIA